MDPRKYTRQAPGQPIRRIGGQTRGRRWLRRHGLLPKLPARSNWFLAKRETRAQKRVRWLRWS